MKRSLFLMFLIIASCQNGNIIQELPCGVNDPLNELSWLLDIKTSFEQSAAPVKRKIYQYTYNANTVFLIDACLGCSDSIQTIYDCSGTSICEFGGILGLNTCPDFSENSTNELLLWEN